MVPGRVFGKEETLKYCTADLLPPTGAPGEKFSYSNTNYTLLGLIIEAVTGNDAALGKYCTSRNPSIHRSL